MTVCRDWTKTSEQQPPEGVVVEAMDSGGHVQFLKRKANMYWTPDGSMYVYYVPSFWRACS